MSEPAQSRGAIIAVLTLLALSATDTALTHHSMERFTSRQVTVEGVVKRVERVAPSPATVPPQPCRSSGPTNSTSR